jgi:3-phosphoinositide dependent protein kinase-1
MHQMMESLQLRAPQPGPPPVVTPLQEGGRGRNMRLSPVQGNGFSSDINFAALLKLSGEEQISFSSVVEALPLRRRASRLLPLPVPPSKTRQLVLTNRRLICLKQHHNRGKDEITIKSELFFRTSEKLKEKEKESRGVLISAEQKSEREFVVLTNTKSLTYATKDAELASTWTDFWVSLIIKPFFVSKYIIRFSVGTL